MIQVSSLAEIFVEVQMIDAKFFFFWILILHIGTDSLEVSSATDLK